MNTRLREIDELEDKINDRLAVILARVHNSMILTEMTGLDAFAIRQDLRGIEDNCKRLAKQTAKAIGMLQAYNTLLAGDSDGD